MNRTIHTQTNPNTTRDTADASKASGSGSHQDAAYEVLSVTNLNAGTGRQSEQTVEVLYQRLGSRWYAFSMIGDEVYFSQVDASEAERRLVRQAAPADHAVEADSASGSRLINANA